MYTFNINILLKNTDKKNLNLMAVFQGSKTRFRSFDFDKIVQVIKDIKKISSHRKNSRL